MKRVFLAVAVLVPAFALLGSACKKDESVASSGSASASVAASASGATSLTALNSASPTDSAALAPTADPDKLPPPAAAATQAAQSVSTANYKSELDTIEKEINGIK
jgi:hypothetical protein